MFIGNFLPIFIRAEKLEAGGHELEGSSFITIETFRGYTTSAGLSGAIVGPAGRFFRTRTAWGVVSQWHVL